MKRRHTSPKADQTAKGRASAPSTSRNRVVLGRVGLVTAGIILALLLAEMGLRAAPRLLPMGTRLALNLFRVRIAIDNVTQEDQDLGVKMKPNSDVLVEGHPDYRYRVKTYLNLPDRGFRGNVESRPLAGVAVGDSFTFGVGVDAEEAWPEQLSRLAERNFTNLGVPAYGPPQYTKMLKKYGLPLRPKLVLYAVYQNDLKGAAHFARWKQEGGPYRPEGGGEERLRLQNRFLARHSRLYQLLLAPKAKDRFLLAVQDHDGVLITNPQHLQNRTPKLGWEMTQRAILDARQLAEREGAAFVLLLLPSKEQTYRHLLATQLENPGQLDLDALNRLVGGLCETNRIKCLDLTPPFLERGRTGEQLYFRIDGHWNVEGHRLAAQTIYDYLIKNKLLETEQQRTGGKK